MNYCYFTLALLLSFSAQPALSQTPAPTPASTATPSPAHLQAAETLLSTVYTKASFNQVIEQVLQARLETNPSAKAYLPEMRTFLQKYMSWSAMRPQMAALYAREFSVPELEELTRFYQSPIGRKSAEKMPMLMRSGMELGQRTVQRHLPELTQAIEAKAKAEQSGH